MPDEKHLITACSFGKIKVDGITYTNDIIIAGDGIIDDWRRKKGHRVDADDLSEAGLETAAHLIVGTGFFGLLSVDGSLLAYCGARGIRLEALRTPKAVESFNACRGEAGLIGAFHISC